MTKEQAIKILKSDETDESFDWGELGLKGTEDYNRAYDEAYDMAIKALEQEPCEDAVSKHMVLETIDSRIEQIKKDADEINKSYYHVSYAEGVYNGYCRLKCDLWDLPSVTPKAETITEFADRCRECGAKYGKLLESKTGHWIAYTDHQACSCCGKWIAYYENDFNYCPNCGVKMEAKK